MIKIETLFTYSFFVVGVILIVKCGDWFVDGASWLARITGIPSFIVGATVVSFGTTLPEVIVSSIAAHEGKKLLAQGLEQAALEKVGMSIGNGIGSVICNTAMIMAISIIFMPSYIKRKSFAPKAIILCLSVFALWIATFFTGQLKTWGSILLFIIFIAFIIENIRGYSTQKGLDLPKPEKSKKALLKNLFFLFGGAVGIAAGSQLLVSYGSKIALSWGVSQSIVGLSAVAIGTSLPELVTTITAIVKKEPSLSIGNVIGANIIDVVLIVPICSLIYGGNLPISNQNIYIDFPFAILVTLIALVPTLKNSRFKRWQGISMLLIYALYLVIACGFSDQFLSLFV